MDYKSPRLAYEIEMKKRAEIKEARRSEEIALNERRKKRAEEKRIKLENERRLKIRGKLSNPNTFRLS